jgi:[ribosomal protein S5]-alanine N-acetyltransferase
MTFPAQLQTPRLLLRSPTHADAQHIFARYAQDCEVCRYMSWTPHRSLDDTCAFLARIIADNTAGTSAGYLIFARESKELLGSVGGRMLEATRIQFGYCLARDSWGQGYATEAARAFVAAAGDQPDIWRIQAYCDLENKPSARVLEKAGLTLEGVLRRYLVLPNLGQTPRDVFCYAKVRAGG